MQVFLRMMMQCMSVSRKRAIRRARRCGAFAPVNVSWGLENRSAAIRVIRSDRPERCRIECRRPGADANPYLALAALAASAADGIERRATPPAAVEGDASAREDLPPLPGSLESALRAFEADDVLRHALG